MGDPNYDPCISETFEGINAKITTIDKVVEISTSATNDLYPLSVDAAIHGLSVLFAVSLIQNFMSRFICSKIKRSKSPGPLKGTIVLKLFSTV
jgi:hypothetical protein